MVLQSEAYDTNEFSGILFFASPLLLLIVPVVALGKKHSENRRRLGYLFKS